MGRWPGRAFHFKPLFVVVILLFTQNTLANSGITFHGKIMMPDGVTPVSSPTTQFRIQIRTPGNSNCLLWEEQQTKDLSSTNGIFTLTIADTSEPTLIPNTLPYTIEKTFSNRTNLTGLTNCSSGTTYNPNPSDGRNLQVYFREQPTDPWEQMPLTKINYVPLALNSVQLEGFGASEFLKIDPASSYTPLTAANVNTLMDIISGSSTLYLKPTSAFTGDVTGTSTTTVVEKIRGTNVVATAPTNGQVLKFNGTSWAPAADDNTAPPGDASYAAKGVVQINTDVATSGLFIAGGVLAMPNVITAGGPTGTAQTVPVITYDQKGRLTAVTTATIDDNTKLPLAGGTMTGNINMGTHDITNATNIAATNASVRNLILNDNDANTITLKSPADIAANYALTLPINDGAAGEVLSTDGNGVLSWVTASAGGVTNVSSANPYLSVATPTTTPVLTLNVGTVANTVAAGDDARITGALQTATYDADVLPAASCTTAQTAYWNSIAGTWACQSINAAATGAFVDGGNTFAATATLGTNSNHNLEIETNGTTKMTIQPDGKVGIGTTSPQLKLDVVDGEMGVRSGTVKPRIGIWAENADLFQGELNFDASRTNGTALPNSLDTLGAVTFGNITNQSAAIYGVASENHSGTASGGFLAFHTTPNTTISTVERMRIDQKGNVGIGTSSPATKLDVAGGVRIGAEATVCAAGLAGTIRYNGGAVEYCNGSSWLAFGVSGAGLTSLGGQVGSTQTFAAGAAGTAPAITSASDVHTLNVPLASGAGVTSGTISKTEYDSFVAKLTSPLTTKGDLLTRDGTTHVRVPVGTDGQVLTADSADANGIKWSTPNAGTVTSVTSANSYLSVATTTTTPVITANVGTTANTLAAGDDARIVGAFVNGGNTVAATATLGTNSNHDLEFETNGTTKMTVSKTGLVGIGTTSPSATLDVRGYARIAADAGVGLNIDSNSATPAIAPYVSISRSRGMLGAAAYPQASDAMGIYQFTNQDAHATAKITSTATENHSVSASGGDLQLWTTPNGTTNATARMTIDNAGNVGIGTTSPNTTLDINGAVSHRGIAAPALSPAGQGRMYFDSTSNTYKVSQNGSAYSNLITSVSGSGGFIQDGNSFGAAATLGTNDNFALNFETNGATKMTVLPSGNVGIGTTNPTSALEINSGDLNLKSGSVQVAGSLPRTYISNNVADADAMLAGNYPSDTTLLMGQVTNDLSLIGLYNNSGGGFHGFIPYATYGSFFGFTNDWMNPATNAAGSAGLMAGDGYVQILSYGDPYITVDGSETKFSNYSNIANESSTVSLVRKRGTFAAPLPVVAADSIGNINFNANGNFNAESGAIEGIVDAGTIGTRVPLRINFSTSPGGAAVPALRMSILANGNVGVGNITAGSILDVNGAVTHRGIAAANAGLSPAGQGRMYFDSTSNTYKISQNGGAYADILTSASAVGDITDVVAGAGLTGGAASGSATVDIGAGTGIVVNANDVAVDVGTTAGKIVQVQAGGKLPVLDGSNLTNIFPTQTGNAGKVLQTDGTTTSWVAAGGSGTVTSVTSANSYLTVATTTTTPVITAVVGTAANTLAAGDDSRITGALQTSVYDADVLPAASCTTSQTPYWNSIAGTWACQNISYTTSGNVIVGSQTNRTTATTDRGQLALGSTYVQTVNGNVTVDWNNGNIQEINTFVCDGSHTITFNNTHDGAAYSLLLSGDAAHTGTCEFSAAGKVFKVSGGPVAPATGKDILFTFAVVNNFIIYNMTDNLQ